VREIFGFIETRSLSTELYWLLDTPATCTPSKTHAIHSPVAVSLICLCGTVSERHAMFLKSLESPTDSRLVPRPLYEIILSRNSNHTSRVGKCSGVYLAEFSFSSLETKLLWLAFLEPRMKCGCLVVVERGKVAVGVAANESH